MKLIEAISQVDDLTPNTYSARQKVIWLARLEALVHQQLHRDFPGFSEDTDTETELAMAAPFDAGYLHWLEAQIHYAAGDIGLYNNAMSQFRDVLRSFQSHCSRQLGSPPGRFLF